MNMLKKLWRSIPSHERLILIIVAVVVIVAQSGVKIAILDVTHPMDRLPGYWITSDDFVCHEVESGMGMECWNLHQP